MMMRYQRASPDCVPLTNGNKTNNNMKASSSPKQQDMITENTTSTVISSSLESNKPLRFRDHHPTTPSPTHSPARTPSPCHVTTSSSGADVLLQWGQRKRSRVSRAADIRILSSSATDESSRAADIRILSSSATDESSSSSSALARQAKVQRRAAADKSTMPPPPPPTHVGPTTTFSSCRLRKEASLGLAPNRNLEDRSATVNGSPSRSTVAGNGRAASRSIASKRSSPPLEKSDRKMPTSSARSAKDEKANGSSSDHNHRANHIDSTTLQSEQLVAANHSAAEKMTHEVVEWPRIYLALSRKEKEDDFLAMKGTKLPQRPKKRAKNVDRSLQYCFPGMWLADLTRNRYEVREKKSVKKKRRGLKGMENVESESE